MRIGPPRVGRLVPILLVVISLAVAASVVVGSQFVAPTAFFAHGTDSQAILQARLPRTVLGLLVGAALGVAGACMQGLTRNPLADPGLLGVSAGASLAMVFAVSVLGISSLIGYLWFAFAGAAVAGIVVYGVASLGRAGATPTKLVIAGAVVSAGVTSWTSAVLLGNRQTFDVFRSWQVGTIGGRSWQAVLIGLPFLAVGAALAFGGARTLDTLALGDDLATALGRRLVRDRILIGLAVVLLSGAATAIAGPIAFVGLVVPHAARALTGSAHRRVLPLSAGFGAVLVLVADVVGRVILPPTEVQVGIMTAVVGVPVFAWFLRRGRMAGL